MVLLEGETIIVEYLFDLHLLRCEGVRFSTVHEECKGVGTFSVGARAKLLQ